MKKMVAVCALLCLQADVQAGTSVAKYAGEFMAIGVGGRALGLGGAYTALATDVTAGYWNPAGLSHLDYPQLILMHDEQFGNLVNYDYGAVAFPVGLKTSLGLSVIRLGVDDIPDTRNAAVDINGNVTYDPNDLSRLDLTRVSYFNAADWAFYLTYSRRESADFSYGANVKFIRRELGDNSATGIGFDAALWYRPLERAMLGVHIQDITTTFLAWDTGTNELISPTMKVGAAYELDALSGRFTPVIDVDFRFEGREYASTANLGPVSLDVHSGLEFDYRNVVALRVGYSDIKQITFGGGLRLPKLAIDYTFAKFDGSDQLGNTHRISLMFTLESDQFKRPDGR